MSSSDDSPTGRVGRLRRRRWISFTLLVFLVFTLASTRTTFAQDLGLNLTLNLAGATESITVLGVSSIVDTRSAAISALVTEKAMSELPLNGRNDIELTLLQPGVASFNEKDSGAGSSNRGTKLNINGMTFRSNSYLLDGANMRGYPGTVTGSAAASTLGVETIQEFRVVTNAYSADYGRAMGGVVSLVTKSGTNTIRGSGFEFFSDSALDARDFFDRGADPPPFRRNQGRVDYTLSPSDTLFARFTADGTDQTNTAGFPDSAVDSLSRNQFLTAEYKRIVTPALLATTRFSHSRLRFEGQPVFPSVPALAFIAGQNEIGVINIGGGVTALGGTAQNPNTANSFYWTVSRASAIDSPAFGIRSASVVPCTSSRMRKRATCPELVEGSASSSP